MDKKLIKLSKEIKTCQICSRFFTHEPRPVFQLNSSASILIVGQAPGRKAHDTGIPFDDASGDRLRDWMGVSKEIFYDANRIAILPMGFCYPGSGASGDLSPRDECALTWRTKVLALLPNIQLTLVIGLYAMNWHLGKSKKHNLTETVKAWRSYAPDVIPLPHPSPRNNIWLHKNSWFESDVIPVIRTRIKSCVKILC